MKKFFLLLTLSLSTLSINLSQVIPYNLIPDSFYKKDSVKIVVTDSGLGGLSIAAQLFEEIKLTGMFKSVDIVFFNAQPHLNSGYNSMETVDEKVEVFNNALNAMYRNFNPDMILIGCNTLSVIYEYTDFSRHSVIPVLGIVTTGVDLIYSSMKESKNSKVVIFATKTTCSEAKHKKELIERGIGEDRIFLIPCPKLAGNIERDSESRLIDSLVTAYVDTAIGLLEAGDENVYASYNCTHYGYIDNKFQSAFRKKGIEVKDFLNPNPYMVDLLFREEYLKRYDSTLTSIKVISQAELTPAKIGSIYLLIEPMSQVSADALFEYEYIPDFFEWESVVNRN